MNKMFEKDVYDRYRALELEAYKTCDHIIYLHRSSKIATFYKMLMSDGRKDHINHQARTAL